MNNSIKGAVLRIQRMSTEDGPGIRTTVFMKGCPLRCLWCHNPESMDTIIQAQWLESKCIGCDICLDSCPKGAISKTLEGIVIDRLKCDGCGLCATHCPSGAMEMIGFEIELSELLDQVERDRVYFQRSNGGVTVSGGEPTMQHKFTSGLLKGLKDRGLSTALDTCGYCSEEAMGSLIPSSDLILFDIKEIDPEKHHSFTGVSNDVILKRLLQIRDHMKSNGKPPKLWIRTPIIPNFTATHENIQGIGKFLSDNLGPFIHRWELCSINTFCSDKYHRLGIKWPFADEKNLSNEEMEKWIEIAKSSGIDPGLVVWSGMAESSDSSSEY